MRQRTKPAGEEGSIIIIVMMFAMVFLMLGSALFVLNRNSNSATALERKDVKAFNVAEAGVDAAMVALKANWPRSPEDLKDWKPVDPVAFRNNAFPDTKEYPEPTDGQFIEVLTYDDTPNNPTGDGTRVRYDAGPTYDVMWIDSEANVDNDRHRILVQVERLTMAVELPDVALVANTAGGNGQGLKIDVDPTYLGSFPEVDPVDGNTYVGVYYAGKGTFPKDVNTGPNIKLQLRTDSPFSEKVPDSLIGGLKQMAQGANPVSYFDSTNGGSTAATTFLCGENGPGSVVYLEAKNEDPITIAGNTPIGTPAEPVILVIDARQNTNKAIDWRGTAKFYGVVIVLGDILLRGNMDIAGSVLSSGSIENKGGPGLLYNGEYIRRVNQMHTLSVAIVPNTWEEYTIPK